jgi:hypothetical protein
LFCASASVLRPFSIDAMGSAFAAGVRRAQLLEGKGGGDGTTALVVTMLQQTQQQMNQLQRDVLEARRTPAANADPMASMLKGLSTLAEAQNKLAAFAPARATSVGDVELTVAMEKIKLESAAKVREAESQARLYDGAFGFLKEYGPGIAQWVMSRSNQASAAPSPGQPRLSIVAGGAPERPLDAANGGRGGTVEQAQAAPAPLQPGEQRSVCSNCLNTFATTGVEACPRCGGMLVPEAQLRATSTQRVVQ